ncbi:glycosyl hydrolase family 79 C-terminal domain-containing protein [Hymenobacter psoromatis]|uniref:glycosyl hydrolase family 79 C-terminal domain-containing protein n=1 Tax=Hymenobacter psoromatis TaxID=1484116 RepID=UPI001CBE1198|nr:glycosyl hydrolase family 79 C-terminal domain-containing protein [Hymenobacter psoromatis]
MRWKSVALPLLLSIGSVNCKKDATPPVPPAAATLPALPPAQGTALTLALHPGQPGRQLPADFAGLSYEMGSITNPAYFNVSNPVFINLINGLGPGLLRIGANSVDHTAWSGQARRTATPADTITTTDIDRFAAFVQKLTMPVLFGVNLAARDIPRATAEIRYVSQALGPRLVGCEVGNEPNDYHSNGIRPAGYTPGDYVADFNAYYAAIHALLPGLAFSGPATDLSGSWVSTFAAKTAGKVSLLTTHFYETGPGSDPSITITTLIGSPARDATMSATTSALAQTANLPYRVAETNSIYGGGKAGVSNTLAAGLWGARLMWQLAAQNAAGVNFHGGGNGAYTPIAQVNGLFVARPLYYGILLFKAGSQGRYEPVDLSPTPLNVQAFASLGADGSQTVTVFNLESNTPVSLIVAAGQAVSAVAMQRLTGASLDATDGITLGGQAVAADGTFSPASTSYGTSGSSFVVNVPAASAVVFTCK